MKAIRLLAYPIWKMFHYWYVLHERVGDVIFEIRHMLCDFVNKDKDPF